MAGVPPARPEHRLGCRARHCRGPARLPGPPDRRPRPAKRASRCPARLLALASRRRPRRGDAPGQRPARGGRRGRIRRYRRHVPHDHRPDRAATRGADDPRVRLPAGTSGRSEASTRFGATTDACPTAQASDLGAGHRAPQRMGGVLRPAHHRLRPPHRRGRPELRRRSSPGRSRGFRRHGDPRRCTRPVPLAENHDLRRIPIVEPTLAYPLSLIFPSTNPHPGLKAIINHSAACQSSTKPPGARPGLETARRQRHREYLQVPTRAKVTRPAADSSLHQRRVSLVQVPVHQKGSHPSSTSCASKVPSSRPCPNGSCAPPS